ncbi:hypothetical protein GCM10008107_19990 [Psychrosphaera saromensis]|uniref:Uncharacterized protein n=1 Tax=Psychrosphaera saromensis TaxID=716813 RepID=A0A2S7UTU7_9GAMM|nr:hypothetical protein BTO11_02880 [Psychrosphaera saromensis]GHB70548.1 hypothetical protein GCM10008107_19990 [Psychrosphaera saromensis]GLQ13185.1 hypothetical protein GCM10007917_06400 [Psychrosphaera saromensis]
MARLPRLNLPNIPQHVVQRAINGVRTLVLKTLDLHYRNHGAAFGQVLADFKATEADDEKLQQHLDELGFNCNFK